MPWCLACPCPIQPYWVTKELLTLLLSTRPEFSAINYCNAPINAYPVAVASLCFMNQDPSNRVPEPEPEPEPNARKRQSVCLLSANNPTRHASSSGWLAGCEACTCDQNRNKAQLLAESNRP